MFLFDCGIMNSGIFMLFETLPLKMDATPDQAAIGIPDIYAIT